MTIDAIIDEDDTNTKKNQKLNTSKHDFLEDRKRYFKALEFTATHPHQNAQLAHNSQHEKPQPTKRKNTSPKIKEEIESHKFQKLEQQERLKLLVSDNPKTTSHKKSNSKSKLPSKPINSNLNPPKRIDDIESDEDVLKENSFSRMIKKKKSKTILSDQIEEFRSQPKVKVVNSIKENMKDEILSFQPTNNQPNILKTQNLSVESTQIIDQTANKQIPKPNTELKNSKSKILVYQTPDIIHSEENSPEFIASSDSEKIKSDSEKESNLSESQDSISTSQSQSQTQTQLTYNSNIGHSPKEKENFDTVVFNSSQELSPC